MNANYEPGTVAVATVRGVPNVRIMATDNAPRDRWYSGELVDDYRYHDDRHVTDVRPLVVLDVDDIGGSRRVLADLSAAYEATGRGVVSQTVKNIADQVEAQTRPPKPPEPTGLGAVVEDDCGDLWVRAERVALANMHWHSADSPTRCAKWSGIDAVRVLSEGVAS